VNRVQFIAEVSSNHRQSLDRCLRFITSASEVGCDGVKFQMFRLEKLFAPEVLQTMPEIRERKKWELPAEFLPDLAAAARVAGIRFGCTPFDVEQVDLLRPHIDFFKISSYELPWPALLEACAHTDKPVVLSTGMATLGEVRKAVTVLESAGVSDLTLLHCVSGYPVPPEQCNLAAIGTLKTTFPAHRVGWSDHSRSQGVIHRAVHRHQAAMVEFHLDLEGEGPEYSSGHCWLPSEIGPVIASSHEGLRADGSGEKQPADCEQADREWRADPHDGLRPVRAARGRLERKS
jgi:N-acetylneuraminate synthase